MFKKSTYINFVYILGALMDGLWAIALFNPRLYQFIVNDKSSTLDCSTSVVRGGRGSNARLDYATDLGLQKAY